MIPDQSTIELDQDDLTGRLLSDEVFSDQVKVFSQRRGITENDVMTALGAVNQLSGKAGAVIIVLMPELSPEAKDAPGPQYYVRYPIQVIDWPVIRRNAVGGVGISAETIAQRIRQIIHLTAFGRGQALSFDGIVPATMSDPGKVSYVVYFKRIGTDPRLAKPGAIVFSPQVGTGTQTVTLTCPTPDVDIWYTTDGSYPGPKTPTAILYTGAFQLTSDTMVRASAWITGSQQGDVYEEDYEGIVGGSSAVGSAMGSATLGSTAIGG